MIPVPRPLVNNKELNFHIITIFTGVHWGQCLPFLRPLDSPREEGVVDFFDRYASGLFVDRTPF